MTKRHREWLDQQAGRTWRNAIMRDYRLTISQIEARITEVDRLLEQPPPPAARRRRRRAPVFPGLRP
jgi:hypothetical protein